MRKFVLALAAAFIGAAGYVVWPVHTALQIGDAIKAGDTAMLERKIKWESLRASLKSSISAETLAGLETDPDAPQPSIWQRVKAVVAPKVADSVIDRYVTPENLPWFLGYRKAYQGYVRPVLGQKEPTTALAGTWLGGTAVDRLTSFWQRVRSAIFFSPTRFRLEVEDKYRPERRYIGTMELRGLEWKLTELTIVGPAFRSAAEFVRRAVASRRIELFHQRRGVRRRRRGRVRLIPARRRRDRAPRGSGSSSPWPRAA